MVAPVDFSVFTPERMSEPSMAAAILGRLLHRGELVLLLGAGASVGMGLPDWAGLVTTCAAHLGSTEDYSAVSSGRELMRSIDALRRWATLSRSEMKDVVHRALYGDLLDVGEYPESTAVSPLLVALGAMLMRSARGSAGDVFSLNFDDVLEWYLDLHGFSTQVVPELPTLIQGDVDVHVYHLHGFLPLRTDAYETSPWIVFSEPELVDRLAKTAAFPWENLLLNRLQSKVLLGVGTSFSDTDLHISLKRVSEVVTDRPYGFVVGRHSEGERGELMDMGLVPVSLGEHSDVPTFLLEICRGAARL